MKKNVKRICWVIVITFIVSFVMVNYGVAVPKGHRGAMETFGYVEQYSLKNGLNLKKLPFFSKVFFYPVTEQTHKFVWGMKLSSLQDVRITGAINYNLNGDNVYRLHEYVGEEYRKILIDPLLEGAFSQTIGKATPEFIVSNQEMVAEAVKYIVIDQLSQTQLINVRDLRIFKPKFDSAFEKAISDKVVSMQIAEKANIETLRVEEEAKQALLKAEAEGKALKLKSEALRNPLIVQYEVAKALGKWKGSLPSTLMLGNGVMPVMPIK